MKAAAWIVRRLSAGEADLYREIRLRSLRESPQAFGTTYEAAIQRDDASWAKQADEAAQRDDRAIFVVLAGEQTIGLAGLYRDPLDRDCGDLIQMWIAPEWRGSAAGRELLEALFQWAGAHRFNAIRAEITRGNARAGSFYSKHGFRPAGTNGSNEVFLKVLGARLR